MEIIGSQFAITLGAWRLRIGFAIEDTDVTPKCATEAGLDGREAPDDVTSRSHLHMRASRTQSYRQ